VQAISEAAQFKENWSRFCIMQVNIIGKILTAHESSMRVNLTITDGTGELEVTHWIQDESEAVSKLCTCLDIIAHSIK